MSMHVYIQSMCVHACICVHVTGHSVAMCMHTQDEQVTPVWICVHTHRYNSIVCVKISAIGLTLQGLLCQAFWGWSLETPRKEIPGLLCHVTCWP